MNLISNSFCSLDNLDGVRTLKWTYWSPYLSLLRSLTPFPFNLNIALGWVPAGTSTEQSPFIVGTTIGLKGAIVPLIFGSAPFIARQIESALSSVDSGVIEAAYAMGSSPFEIIYRVLLREALPEIIYALIITTVSLISFSAVAGTVGGGGLGDFAIRYGYQHFKTDIMVVTIIILILIIFIYILDYM